MSPAQLKHDLGGSREREALLDERPYLSGFQRLRMQAGENPFARSMCQQPVQRLSGTKPIGPVVS